MALTKSERARITDTVHSIQSAQASLADVDEGIVPQLEEIHECLEAADKNLRGALRSGSTEEKPTA
jgi:hypothetical protein